MKKACSYLSIGVLVFFTLSFARSASAATCVASLTASAPGGTLQYSNQTLSLTYQNYSVVAQGCIQEAASYAINTNPTPGELTTSIPGIAAQLAAEIYGPATPVVNQYLTAHTSAFGFYVSLAGVMTVPGSAPQNISGKVYIYAACAAFASGACTKGVWTGSNLVNLLSIGAPVTILPTGYYTLPSGASIYSNGTSYCQYLSRQAFTAVATDVLIKSDEGIPAICNYPSLPVGNYITPSTGNGSLELIQIKADGHSCYYGTYQNSVQYGNGIYPTPVSISSYPTTPVVEVLPTVNTFSDGACPPAVSPPPPPPAASTVLGPFTLTAGQCKHGSQMFLCMQADGNLVLYHANSTDTAPNTSASVWATNHFVGYDYGGFTGPTQSSAMMPKGQNCGKCVASFQSEGNLVLYRPNGTAYWASTDKTVSGAKLVISHTTLMILNSAGQQYWN